MNYVKPAERWQRLSMRVYWKCSAIVLIILILISWALSGVQDNVNGVLLFGSKRVTGNIHQYDDVNFSVFALNYRLSPVSIAVTSQCGCTAAGNYDHTILPFGVVEIPLTLSASDLQGGQYAKNVELNFISGHTSWHREGTIVLNVHRAKSVDRDAFVVTVAKWRKQHTTQGGVSK